MGWHAFLCVSSWLYVCCENLRLFQLFQLLQLNMHAHRYKCSNSDCTITTKSVMQTTNLTKKTKGCFAIWMNLITRWLIICSFKFDKFVVRKTAGLVYAQTTNLTKKTNYVVIFCAFGERKCPWIIREFNRKFFYLHVKNNNFRIICG